MSLLNKKVRRVLNFIRGLYKSIYSKQKYCIKKGYTHRNSILHFDDRNNNDDWQKEVYEYAKFYFNKRNFKTILDIGCGSGYKLVKHFEKDKFIGVEIEPTLTYLKEKYPQNNWDRLENVYGKTFDMIIISDVLEHIENPCEFLNTILSNIHCKTYIISTPERDLMHLKFHYGPPINLHHYREWNFKEFEKFIKNFMDISEHFISNKKQSTQLIIGNVKNQQIK